MNPYHEFLFLVAKFTMVGLTLTSLWAVGIVFHNRYVKGYADAFKPERRVGPADRRARVTGR